MLNSEPGKTQITSLDAESAILKLRWNPIGKVVRTFRHPRTGIGNSAKQADDQEAQKDSRFART